MDEWNEVIKALEFMIVDRAVETMWIQYTDSVQGLIYIARHKDMYGQDIPVLDLVMSQDFVDGEWTKPVIVEGVYGFSDCHETMYDIAQGINVMFYVGETVRALDSGE